MSFQIILKSVFLITKILGNYDGNVLDLMLQFLFLLEIVFYLFLDDLCISLFFGFEDLFPFFHHLDTIHFSSNLLDIILLPSDHLLQILQKIIKRSQIFLISCLILCTKFKYYF